MLNPEDQQIINQVRADFEAARQQLYDTNLESRRAYVAFYDKILMYSAGAFSFGVALISLALDNEKKEFLARTFYGLPLIHWLYASIFCYILAVFFVLLSRMMYATYESAFGKRHYHQDGKTLTELEIVEIREALPLTTTKDEEAVAEQTFPFASDLVAKRQQLKELESVLKKNKLEEFVTCWTMKLSRWLSIVAIVVGTFLLFSFSVQLAQMIVWG